jgi:diguanylate cyclase (GGDEF)-like protein
VHEIDPLTGVPNRLGLASRLDHAIAVARREGGSAAVLFIDLDGFKAVNDGHGHAAGDAVLREIAARLRARLRDTDTVARLGGDEFVVVAERMGDARQASTLARKLLGVIAEPIAVGGETVGVTASIGISLGPEDGRQGDALIAAADAAMYAAKRGGKDAFRYFSPRMHEEANARVALEQALRDGLERGELRLAYQPEWDVATDRVVAVEAQLFWPRPDGGIVPAEDVVGVADQGTLSGPIARWLIATACAGAARLRRAGASVPVAVRVTPRQIGSRTLTGDLCRALRTHALPPEALRLEVGDGASTAPARDVVASLRDLDALGVGLGLAEFGHGAASLTALAAAPYRTIRLARDLVTDARRSRREPALLAAIVAASRALGLPVIADGADDRGTTERLSALGCGRLQGAYVAPAVPVDALVRPLARVRQHRAPIGPAGRRWRGRAWRAAEGTAQRGAAPSLSGNVTPRAALAAIA